MTQLNIIAAFDMRDPIQVAALNSVWQFSPVEKAQHRVSAAYNAVNAFVTRFLTPDQGVAFLLDRSVPAGIDAAKADQLAALIAAEKTARAALASIKAGVAGVAAMKAA